MRREFACFCRQKLSRASTSSASLIFKLLLKSCPFIRPRGTRFAKFDLHFIILSSFENSWPFLQYATRRPQSSARRKWVQRAGMSTFIFYFWTCCLQILPRESRTDFGTQQKEDQPVGLSINKTPSKESLILPLAYQSRLKSLTDKNVGDPNLGQWWWRR